MQIEPERGKKMKKCGLCGSTENLVGPHAGGPFTYYCKSCKELIGKWEKAKKEHRDFLFALQAKTRKGGEKN
jgi:hypothetical protein